MTESPTAPAKKSIYTLTFDADGNLSVNNTTVQPPPAQDTDPSTRLVWALGMVASRHAEKPGPTDIVFNGRAAGFRSGTWQLHNDQRLDEEWIETEVGRLEAGPRKSEGGGPRPQSMLTTTTPLPAASAETSDQADEPDKPQRAHQRPVRARRKAPYEPPQDVTTPHPDEAAQQHVSRAATQESSPEPDSAHQQSQPAAEPHRAQAWVNAEPIAPPPTHSMAPTQQDGVPGPSRRRSVSTFVAAVALVGFLIVGVRLFAAEGAGNYAAVCGDARTMTRISTDEPCLSGESSYYRWWYVPTGGTVPATDAPLDNSHGSFTPPPGDSEISPGFDPDGGLNGEESS